MKQPTKYMLSFDHTHTRHAFAYEIGLANPFYGFGGGGQWIGPFPMPIPYYGSAARSSAEILIPSVLIGLLLILRR